MRGLVLSLSCLLLGCEANAPADEASPAAREDASPAAGDAAAATPPAPAPMPSVEGAIADEAHRLHVMSCAEAHPCPQLEQAEAEGHCAALDQGGTGWRLPTRKELARLPSLGGLESLEGFHWSSTPYAEDPAQVWIFDPASGSETTIPKDRKPFTVRCVRDAP